MKSRKLFVLILLLPLTGCMGWMTGSGSEIEPWPLPPRPSGLEFEGDGERVCTSEEDFKALLLYVEELRKEAKDHGAVSK